MFQKIVKAAFVDLDKEKYDLNQSICALPISVGQQYHENEKFDAAIKLIDQTFKSCVLVICDSLQRHTLSIFDKNDNHLSDIHQYANQLGDEWLKRNETTIKKLSIPYKIYRWDYWLNHKLYKERKQMIDGLYEHDVKFKQAIQNSVNAFLERCKKRNPDKFDFDKFYPISLEYFKEECAIMPLWIEENINFEIYPGKRPEAMVVAHEYFVKPRNLLIWLNLRFR